MLAATAAAMLALAQPAAAAPGITVSESNGPGGSFTVTLSVVARDPVTGTDCTQVVCSVVTRADHTRTADRSQDTRVRLTFGQPPPHLR